MSIANNDIFCMIAKNTRNASIVSISITLINYDLIVIHCIIIYIFIINYDCIRKENISFHIYLQTHHNE